MKRDYRTVLLATLAGLCLAGSNVLTHAQNQVILSPVKDNTLYESATGAIGNGAGEAFFVGRSGQLNGSIRRGLLAFRVGDVVPAGSVVIKVNLSLHMSRNSFSSPASTIEMHRLLEDWGEGTSNALGNEGSGVPAGTNEATWLHRFYDTVTWTHPGGEYDPEPSAAQTVSDTGFYTWESTSKMVSDVQEWVNNPDSNSGWLLIGDEGRSFTAKRFDSRESPDSLLRPRLTVTFLPLAAGVEEDGDLPETALLHQNYPNPFNPSTMIKYTIGGAGDRGPGASKTMLVVFDVLGRQVATLVNEEKAPGSYEVRFDGTGLASGVYLYRLSAGNFVLTRKMVIVK